MSGDEQFRAWTEIDYSIQTGKKAFDKVFGKPIFDYLGEHPDKARIFDAAMVGIHGRESSAVLNAYDFSGIGTLVDIGGGNGSQLIALLQAHPTMRGILFDLPHVIERAKAANRRGRPRGPLRARRRQFLRKRARTAPTPTSCGTSSTTGTMKSRSRSSATATARCRPTASCWWSKA